MMNLNLLSLENKKRIKTLKTYYILKNVSFLIVSILLIITTVLSFSFMLLKNFSNTIDGQINNEIDLQRKESIVSIEEATKQLNNQLKRISTIQQDYVKWSDVLNEVARAVPPGITLNVLSVDKTSKRFSLSGIARDRLTLRSFEDQLNLLPELTEATAPLSSLAQRENILFEITGTLSDEIYQ